MILAGGKVGMVFASARSVPGEGGGVTLGKRFHVKVNLHIFQYTTIETSQTILPKSLILRS